MYRSLFSRNLSLTATENGHSKTVEVRLERIERKLAGLEIFGRKLEKLDALEAKLRKLENLDAKVERSETKLDKLLRIAEGRDG